MDRVLREMGSKNGWEVRSRKNNDIFKPYGETQTDS